MNPTFTIKLSRNVIKARAIVGATEAGLIGCYHTGKPFKPTDSEVRAALPFAYRKAFDRALKWWQSDDATGRAMPLKTELRSLRGAPMGTVIASPNWESAY